MLGGGVIAVIVIVVALAVLAGALGTVYRSTCGSGFDERSRYSFVIPGQEPSLPDECRDPRSGLSILRQTFNLGG